MTSDKVTLYGKTSEERLLEEKQESRLIVKEILDYNVSDRQLYQIIKLLAENLESYAHMQLLTWLVDELQITDFGDVSGLKEKVLEQLAASQGSKQ